jgi:hypothetical protein
VANGAGVFVLANNGTVSNTTGVFVLANNGIVANGAGVFVRANNGIVANGAGVFVLANSGIVANSTGVFVNASSIDSGTVPTARLGSGTASSTTFLAGDQTYKTALTSAVTSVATGNGMVGGSITSTGTVSVLANNGIVANGAGVFVNANTGIVANGAGVFVNAAYIDTISANSARWSNGSITNTFTVGTSAYFVSNGNVGISNTAPGHKLTVNGNIATSNSFILLTSANPAVAPFPNIRSDDPRGVSIQFGNSTNLSYNWVFQGDRNVVLYDDGTPVYNTGTAISDRRHKIDITPTSLSGIGKVSELQVVDFKWKPDSPMHDGGFVHTGFIAQDVDVTYNDAVKVIGGTYLLHKEELVPLVVKAIQELQQQIEELKGRITALENKT